MLNDGESADARRIREKLNRNAEGDSTGLRKLTLERFFRACDDIMSGEAYRMALSLHGSVDPKPFRGRKLNATSVGRYVRMRSDMCRSEGKLKNEWTGPVRETIAGDADLRAYIDARNVAREQIASTKTPEDIQTVLDRVVDPGDRRTLRAKVNELWELKDQVKRLKSRNDMLVYQFKQLAGVDFQDFVDGKTGPAPFAVHSANGHEANVRNLLKRLTDNLFLTTFGLVYRNNRIKMEYGDEADLIYPEEIEALRAMAK